MVSKLSTITLIVGTVLVIGGMLMWVYSDINSKIFQLSNDVVGAGLFSFVLGLVLLVAKR